MNDTTRKYPRTLHEAFPYDADYAHAITRYTNPHRLNYWAIWGFVIFLCLSLFFAV
jgi:hypothetical protein